MRKKWKKGLSLLLTMAMLTALTPTVALAAHDSTQHDKSFNTFINNDVSTGDFIGVPAGNYYLENDLTISKPLSITADVSLCLNNCTITFDSITTTQDKAISVYSGGTLTIDDCGTNGKIQCQNSSCSVLSVGDGTTITLNNGTITGGNAPYWGGGVHVYGSGSTFIMNGGAITGNKVSSGGSGGGVYIGSNGTFTMNNGSISGNTASSGAGVYMSSGEFNMSNGSITNNSGNAAVEIQNSSAFNMSGGTISDHSGTYGGVYMTSGSFNMSGGSIQDNAATNDYYAGGVSITTGADAVILSGSATIKNNTVNGSNIDVYLGDDIVINAENWSGGSNNTTTPIRFKKLQFPSIDPTTNEDVPVPIALAGEDKKEYFEPIELPTTDAVYEADNGYLQFSLNKYSITIDTAIQNGSVAAKAVIKNSDGTTIDRTEEITAPVWQGKTISLEVTPDPGYKLSGNPTVTGSEGYTNNATFDSSTTYYSFFMPSRNVTASAAFDAIDYAIAYTTTGSGGTITGNASRNVNENVTITVTPDPGYALDKLTYTYTDWNGTPQSEIEIDKTTRTFTMPAAQDVSGEDLIVYATFKALGADAKIKFAGPSGDTTAVPIKITSTSNSSLNGTYGGVTFTNGTYTGTLSMGNTLAMNVLPVGDYNIEIDPNSTLAGYNIGSRTHTMEIAAGAVYFDNSLTPAANGTLTVNFTRKTYPVTVNAPAGTKVQIIAEGSIVDENDSDGSNYEVTGLDWGKTYTLRIDAVPAGYEMPTDKDFILTADGGFDASTTATVDNGVLRVELEQTLVKVRVVGADGSDLSGVGVQILKDGTAVQNWTSDGTTKEFQGVLSVQQNYTLEVTSVPDGYSIPSDKTFSLSYGGTLDGGGDTLTIQLWNGIPVDRNGDGTVEPADQSVAAEPSTHDTFTDKGNSTIVYLPVDIDGDDTTAEHYVPSTALEDRDDDGLYEPTAADTPKYVPVDKDGNAATPEGFIKVKDEEPAGNPDGIYEDGSHNTYIPVDTNNDGDPEEYVKATENPDGTYKDENNDIYIPVDTDGDGERDVFVKPTSKNSDGTFTDNNGTPETTDDKEYLPVDTDGDADTAEVYVPDGVLKDTDGDGLYMPEPSAEPKYVPVNKDADDAPEGFIKVTDDEGDGIYEDADKDDQYIPVDTDNIGGGTAPEDPEEYVKANKNDDGTYTDDGGNTYIPVDTNGDGNRDVFVDADDNDNGTFTDENDPGDSTDDDIYIAVDTDGDGDIDVFVEAEDADSNDDADVHSGKDDNKRYIPVDIDGDDTIDQFVPNNILEETDATNNIYEPVNADTPKYEADEDADGNPVKFTKITDSNGNNNNNNNNNNNQNNGQGGNGGRGGNGGSNKYNITINVSGNGDIESSSRTAKKGAKITLTAEPDEGYDLNSLKVVDRNGKEIKLTNNGDGTYSFEMPRSSVTVTGVFGDGTENAEINIDELDLDTAIVLKINDTVARVFGEYIVNDVPPTIRNARTMLPIRFIVESLGGTVAWDEAAQRVTILKDNTVIEIVIGQGYALVNGERVALDSPAFIENDRTYLPLRFVAENLGAIVLWDGDTQQIYIIPNVG